MWMSSAERCLRSTLRGVSGKGLRRRGELEGSLDVSFVGDSPPEDGEEGQMEVAAAAAGRKRWDFTREMGLCFSILV